MGWLHKRGQTRAGLIKERIKSWENKTGTKAVCLNHAARGNVLWTVWEVIKDGNISRFIGCDLLRNDRSFGWGYKDMEEASHPYYYTCPVSFLGMVPVASEEWRKGVLAYHEKRRRKFRLGEIVNLVDGCKVSRVTITSVKPLRGEHKGTLYRFSKRLVA